jgi:thiol-disulfide isomerase/thioredoxin
MKIKIFLMSMFIISYLFLGIITYGEHTYLLPLMLLSSFIITYLFAKKYNKVKSILLFLNIPYVLIVFLTSLIGNDFSRSLCYILFVPIISFLGYLYLNKKKVYIPVLSLILIYFVSFILNPNLYSVYKNNKSEKNIIFPKTIFFDKNKNEVILKKDKIIILDFWSTSCTICFKKFPNLEDVYNKYINNSNIEIYAVNVPEKNDVFNRTIRILDSIGYKFPKLYAKSAKEIENSLHINSFPHLIIIKNGKIRYDGILETDKNVRFYSVESEIEKLLNEKE